jgi:PAS domain S-box-containing protein
VDEFKHKSLNHTLWSICHPDDLEQLQQRHRDRLAGKPVSQYYVIRIIRKDGSIGWIEISANLIDNFQEPLLHVLAVDITKQKQGSC